MDLVIIFLVGGLGIMIGFAARQMQDLRENAAEIDNLRIANEELRNENEELKEGENSTIADLRAENEALRRDSAAHVSNLEMVLGHTDDQSA